MQGFPGRASEAQYYRTVTKTLTFIPVPVTLQISLIVKDASRLTAAGGASAVPADGTSGGISRGPGRS